MPLRYEIVDVFTDRAYAGNPLAVVHRADALETEQMQAVAAEFGLSETAFPLPPTTPDATYRLRIFTPARELPFAGHPSVGAAWVLADAGSIPRGDVVQECGAGLLPVHVDADGAQVVGGPGVVGPELDATVLAAAAGLDARDVDPDLPAGVASAGVPFAFLPVRADAVARAVPDGAAVRAATGSWNGLVVVAVDAHRAHLRMFAPQLGVTEDPATGSAAVALGVFLAARGVLPDGRTDVRVAQGAEIGRPSLLELTVEVEGGAAVRTAVGGGVARVARGELVAVP
jgi:trans-2,3-dihydro-3-hydroxyanthranilate isomerase